MLWRENLSNIDKFLEEAVHLFDFSIIEIKKKSYSIFPTQKKLNFQSEFR